MLSRNTFHLSLCRTLRKIFQLSYFFPIVTNHQDLKKTNIQKQTWSLVSTYDFFVQALFRFWTNHHGCSIFHLPWFSAAVFLPALTSSIISAYPICVLVRVLLHGWATSWWLIFLSRRCTRHSSRYFRRKVCDRVRVVMDVPRPPRAFACVVVPFVRSFVRSFIRRHAFRNLFKISRPGIRSAILSRYSC